MSRLHGALSRASEGKAPILPPDAGVSPGLGAEVSQSAFTVPWSLDAQAPAEPVAGPAEPAAGETVFVRQAARLGSAGQSEARDRLVVGAAASAQTGTLALAVEQYRKLAAALHHAQGSRGLKCILVTSALPGEGKSLTASNLALTLSESYQRRVLLIDGDMRRPSLHDVFGVPNGAGLSDGLSRDGSRGVPVLEVSERLSILPSGHPVDDPTGLLTSERMRRLLEGARTGYDWVIVDTPPVGLLSDAKLLSEMVDGVVLVVEAAKTPYPDLLRAIDAIGRERLLGTVLNRLTFVAGGTKYYQSYYRRADAPTA
jgi:capsular exopolysaccharide synthesis family protein